MKVTITEKVGDTSITMVIESEDATDVAYIMDVAGHARAPDYEEVESVGECVH